MEIKVMTFNIHHGKGMDRKVNLSRIAEVIDLCDADIIGLNEVDSHFSKRSLFEEQASWLANQLQMDYAFSPSISLSSKHSTKLRQYGNALLSRFPIMTKKSRLLNRVSGIIEGRSILDTFIQINQYSLRVIVTHLSLNPFLHRKQIDFIVNQLNMTPNPVILMGDLNMKPESKGWKILSKDFQDAWHVGGNGSGYTYPSHQPRSRLDYIFVSRHFQVVNAEIVTKIPIASDHLPLTATLYYKNE